MTSVRHHLLTGEPILYAPERAARPRAFAGDEQQAAVCPFCPGNEEETPAEIARIGEPWRVRVFPNKYPSIENAEVIVESPRHEEPFEDIGHAADAVRMYVARYRAHDAAYVSIFKNDGPAAGSSIPHHHSQVMPVPFVPPRIAREAETFRDHCPLCGDAGVVIDETPHFRWLAPHGSWMAYQQWIVPRRHTSEMNDDAADELGALLQRSARRMRALAGAFNWAFINFPREPRAHWYVDLFPRMTVLAGFELGTGTFVEIIEPAAAARLLK